jgi:hypothetical protein
MGLELVTGFFGLGGVIVGGTTLDASSNVAGMVAQK